MADRAVYLAWCKTRALAYCDNGRPIDGLLSMFADLEEHKDTADHSGIMIGTHLILIGALSDAASARKFIEGFN